jgi:Flp pilus assembly protein TadG
MNFLFQRLYHDQRRRLGREEGQTLVEFAFALPALLLFLLGVVEFGTAFYYQTVLTNAVDSAAQAVMAGAGSATASDPCLAADNAIVAAAPVLINKNNLGNFQFSLWAYTFSGTPPVATTGPQLGPFNVDSSSASCPTATTTGSSLTQYAPVKITATYGYTLSRLFGGSTITLTSTTSEAVQ